MIVSVLASRLDPLRRNRPPSAVFFRPRHAEDFAGSLTGEQQVPNDVPDQWRLGIECRPKRADLVVTEKPLTGFLLRSDLLVQSRARTRFEPFAIQCVVENLPDIREHAIGVNLLSAPLDCVDGVTD